MRILHILLVFVAAVAASLLFGDVFTFNMLKAGWMVSVDAAIFIVPLAAALAHDQTRQRTIVFLITIAHAVFGYIGLGLQIFGNYEAGQFGWSIWIPLGIATVFGMRFIVDALSDDEEDDISAVMQKLAVGLLSAAALTLYGNVSIDELFAVLQRYQWMTAQGWDHYTMAYNIGLSMVVLWCILATVQHYAGQSDWLESWCKKHGDRAMFVVFSLIMYYMVRGILQNGLGYEPWQHSWTGIAPTLLVLGFILTWLLKWALGFEPVRVMLRKVFFL